MNWKEKWSAWKSRLHDWYAAFFGRGGTAAQPEEVPAAEQQPVQIPHPEQPEEIPPAEEPPEELFPDLSANICERLKYLRKKRIFSVRKKSNRPEWQVRPADFTDAYLFLLGIPGLDISRLQCRMVADNISYRLACPANRLLELTDNTRRETAQALLRLTVDKKCILKIYFINS